MARQVFFSFHFKPDNWRSSMVRSIGKIEGNKAASDNDWEKITDAGDEAIRKWINDQMDGRSCVIVLIGKDTARRKWINYEIKKAWDEKKGLLGIYIHNLKDSSEAQSTKGSNPFDGFTFKSDGITYKMEEVVKAYNPPYSESTSVYNYIKTNIEDWIEEAIKIRGKY